MARTEGFEPPLFGFVDRCVIQLHHVLIRRRAVDLNHRLESHLFSKQRRSPNRFTLHELLRWVGRDSTPQRSGTTGLQSACFSHLHTYPLAVPTGVEPANIDLKDRRLYRFAYGTKKFLRHGRRTHRLGFEPRTTVLETVMLPLHHLCMWSQRRELNPHLSAYEAAALPLSYAAVFGL